MRKRERAMARRNYVIGRMLERGYITEAKPTPRARRNWSTHDRLAGDQFVAASHFVEEVRRQVQEQYGEEALYDGGLSIRSTLDTRLQLAAARALRAGLEDYDRRHAWRGPIGAGDAVGRRAGAIARGRPRRRSSPAGCARWSPARSGGDHADRRKRRAPGA